MGAGGIAAPRHLGEVVVAGAKSGGEVTTQWADSSGRARTISRTSPVRIVGTRVRSGTWTPKMRREATEYGAVRYRRRTDSPWY